MRRFVLISTCLARWRGDGLLDPGRRQFDSSLEYRRDFQRYGVVPCALSRVRVQRCRVQPSAVPCSALDDLTFRPRRICEFRADEPQECCQAER